MTDLAERPGTVELEQRLAEHRAELTGYCYRMLGSSSDAEDAVQDTMVRAWRSLDRLADAGALRGWLYRIATNVCLDSLDGRKRRAFPVDLSAEPSAPVEASLAGVLPEGSWVEPALDRQVLPVGGDPAELAVQRESVRLAFVAALQLLPPRQRAVLVLREVLRWKADEVADLLDTTVAAVNSALQRARATLVAQRSGVGDVAPALAAGHAELLERYLDAFARYDIDALVALLHADAVMDMPPFAMWLRGSADIASWFVGPGHGCRGSRVLPLALNGGPGFAQWRSDGAGGFEPWAVHALELSQGRVVRMTAFLGPRLFDTFGLPRSP